MGNNAAQGTARGAKVINLPNTLTVLRLLLVPLFVYLMILQGVAAQWWATVVFVLAAFTDHLDGFLARRWNMITDFGKIADPIADKALVLSAMFMLSLQGILPWAVTIIIFLRELSVTLLRFFMISKVVIAASWGGKLKTVTQMLFIFGMLVPWGSFLPADIAAILGSVFWWIAVLATVITAYTGFEYFYGAFKAGGDSEYNDGVRS